jgi:m7GpppX diphosphatase
MIKETPEYYNNMTLPNAIKMDKMWIYSILDGNAEQDRILYQDDNFVLLKDIKWNGDKLNEIHLLALPRRRDLLSIRDIDGSNIDLIQQIDNISRSVMSSMYDLSNDRIRSYFHYYPSYWHLHVHFDTYAQSTSSDSVDFCRSLHDVVENVKLDPNYYKKITLNVIKDYF